MSLWILWIALHVLSRSSDSLADCELMNFGANKTGRFTLPLSEGGYLVDEICQWTIEPELEDYLVVVNVKEIDLKVTENIYTSTCAALFYVNKENFDCHRRDPFCVTYASSDKCNHILSDYSSCLSRNLESPKIEVVFDALMYNSNSKEFDVEYEVLDCAEKTTSSPDIGAIHDFITRKIRRNWTTTASTNQLKTKGINDIELIVILLPIGIVIIAAIAMTTCFRSRRTRNKSQEHSSGSDDQISVIATKNTTANVVYQSWNPRSDRPPSLPPIDTEQRNLSIPSVILSDTEYTSPNIYEAIATAPPPSVITPRFSEFGQRYFEIGLNSFRSRGSDGDSESAYNVYDMSTVESQDPYDMAVPDPGTPQQFEGWKSQHK